MPEQESEDPIWDLLMKDALSGELGRRIEAHVFATHGFAYVGSTKGPQYVDKIYPDGRRETGECVQGEFKPLLMS